MSMDFETIIRAGGKRGRDGEEGEDLSPVLAPIVPIQKVKPQLIEGAGRKSIEQIVSALESGREATLSRQRRFKDLQRTIINNARIAAGKEAYTPKAKTEEEKADTETSRRNASFLRNQRMKTIYAEFTTANPSGIITKDANVARLNGYTHGGTNNENIRKAAAMKYTRITDVGTIKNQNKLFRLNAKLQMVGGPTYLAPITEDGLEAKIPINADNRKLTRILGTYVNPNMGPTTRKILYRVGAWKIPKSV